METVEAMISKEKLTVTIGENEYIISSRELDAMEALSTFADNAFLGYSGDLRDKENDVLSSYSWLVREYLELITTAARDEKKRLTKLNKALSNGKTIPVQ